MSLCCCIRLVSFYQAYQKAKGQREGWSRYSQFQSCSQEHTRLPFHHFFILFSGSCISNYLRVPNNKCKQ